MAKRTKEQSLKTLRDLCVVLYEKDVTSPEVLRKLTEAKQLVRRRKQLKGKGNSSNVDQKEDA